MMDQVDTRRVTLFCALAFGIAWAVSLAIYLTGGLVESPMLVEQAGISLALVLLLVVMWAPAIAHILTRLFTQEGWQRTHLQPRLKQAWPTWVAAWLLPGLLTIVGAMAFFLVFPRYYDSSLATLREMMEGQLPQGGPFEENLWPLVALQVVQALLISPILNSPATFGEEFGWRAYLQPKLMPLGSRRALVLTGAIWGVWHWPVILMGYNYGFDYPGAPFLGPVAMVWFTIVVGVLLGWLTIRGRSVWPAVIGHAALNGMAGLGLIFVEGQPNTLLGPAPVGLIGGLGFTVLALLILLRVSQEPAQDVADQ